MRTLAANSQTPHSAKYWEERYLNNGNSGAGSYGRLAIFKARVLNDFLLRENVQSVIEWGCGDGHQLSLVHYKSYIGIDVSPTAIKLCRDKFSKDPNKEFYLASNPAINGRSYDLSLSLDVIFHLTEDDIFDNYMNRLFSSSHKFVVIYASNSDTLEDPASHVLHRKFTDWIMQNFGTNWHLVEKIENPFPWDERDKLGTSFSNFFFL